MNQMRSALRTTALIALIVGAAGSIGFMLYFGRNAPWLLIVLFTIWDLSPFVALAMASVLSKRWSSLTRATLTGVTWLVTAGTLAIYAADAVRPPKAQAAFVYVVVPAVSWVVGGLAIGVAALVSRKRSRR